MSRLDDLPPDQRATLSLLLRRRKSYAEVATMLDIDERAVHDRAHAALAVLAAPQARELSAEQREQIGDYLLGQRSGVAERLATRNYLDSAPQARAWASALAAELAPLASAPLPEIPAGSSPSTDAAEPAAPQPAATSARGASSAPAAGGRGRERAEQAASASGSRGPEGARASAAIPGPSVSRRGGALLLGAIVIVIVLAVVLLSKGGGSSHNSSATSSAETSGSGETSSSSQTSTGKAAAGSSGSQSAKAKEDKRITLTSPDSSSKAVGVAEVLSEGSQYAFYLAAQHLEPSKGFFYAVWLYNSPTSFEALSRAPTVGSSGAVQGGALLPKDAGKYHTMLLTRETASIPTKPGPIVLRGAFALH